MYVSLLHVKIGKYVNYKLHKETAFIEQFLLHFKMLHLFIVSTYLFADKYWKISYYRTTQI